MEYSVEEPEDREDLSRSSAGSAAIADPTHRFVWRGELADASCALDAWVWRSRLRRAWSAALNREGVGLSYGVLGVSAFVSMFVLGWAGPWGPAVLLVSLLVHAGAAGVVWWCSHMQSAVDTVRVERLRRWLASTSATVSEGTRVDLDIDLAPSHQSCCATGTCGAPWFRVGLETPSGITVRTRITAGGACPALRNRAEEGTSWIQMDLGGDPSTLDADEVDELVQELAFEEVPHGFHTRRARSSSLRRARWEVQQDHNVAGGQLPTWPMERLLRGRGASSHPTPHANTQTDKPHRHDAYTAVLWPVAERWGWASGLHHERWVRLIGSPALVWMGGLMMMHGVLGACLLGMQAFSSGLGTGGVGGSLVVGSVSSWFAVFCAVAVMGAMGVWTTARRWAREAERVHAHRVHALGSVSVDEHTFALREVAVGQLDEDGEFQGGGHVLEHNLDLWRPFSVHITRERGQIFGGNVRLFVSLYQDQAKERVSCGFSVEVGAHNHTILQRIPVKHALYPEIRPHEARVCLEHLHFSLNAHAQDASDVERALTLLSSSPTPHLSSSDPPMSIHQDPSTLAQTHNDPTADEDHLTLLGSESADGDSPQTKKHLETVEVLDEVYVGVS